MDSSVDAAVKEKYTASIFRAEVAILGIEEIYMGLRKVTRWEESSGPIGRPQAGVRGRGSG